MRYIGIQFLKESISVAYYNQNKLVGKTVEFDHELEDGDYIVYLSTILDDLGINRKKKYRVVFSIPPDMAEISTLKQLVPISNKRISAKKKDLLIRGQLENLMETSSENHILEYSVIDDKKLYNGKMLTTVVVMDKEKAYDYFRRLKLMKELMPAALDLDAEALRRLVPKESKNVVIVHFFKNENDMVGIYLYRDTELIGVRYLVSRLYDEDSLISEIERMIVYCKTFYRDFEVEQWYAFGSESEVEKLGDKSKIINHPLKNCTFAVSAGLAIKDEFEKKGGARKNGV